MACFYLRNHDEFASILVYNSCSGDCHEVARDSLELKESETWVGFYVSIPDEKPTGVYASPSGPVFFHGQERFNLLPKMYRAAVDDVGELRRFILYKDDSVILNILYEPPKYYDWDCWSDEVAVDFFLSMRENLNSDRFFDFYTREYNSE